MTVIHMSFAGAVMILAIAAIRAAALNRLPKRTFVVLWELVLLRLLVPFSIPSVTSIYTLFAGIPTPAAQTDVYRDDDTVLPQGALIAPQEVGVSHSVPVWTIIRLSGTALCAVGAAAAYLLALRRFRNAGAVRSGYAAERLKREGLRRNVSARLSDKISSPLTYGIFHPVILLPSDIDTEDRTRLEYVLTHELTHIRRFDILRKLFAAAAVCVHWFDPAVWAMYLLFNRDIELACDEAVVRSSGTDCRSEYAGTLIEMEEKRAKAPSLSAYFSKNAAEERIVAIMKTRRLKAVTTVLACAVVIAVAAVFATSAYVAKQENDADMPDERGTFSTESGGTKVLYILTDKEKQRLREKYDIRTMMARENGAYTQEYLDLRDELISLKIFTREQADRFFFISVPAHTRILNGPLGETGFNEASNIIEELDNAIEKQKELIAYITEKSEDPARSQPEDIEYLERSGDIALKLMFRDLLYSIMR